jgi:hypothetical protein
MKIQVWMRDGYGQGSILKTLDSIDGALDFAKKHVSDVNFDNALTPQERRRNWELYIPLFESNSYLYCGKFANNYTIFSCDSDSVCDVNSSSKFRLYIGSMSGQDFYVEDQKNKEVIDLDSDSLRNKGFVFFKIVK